MYAVVNHGTHDCVRDHVADVCLLNTCVCIIIRRRRTRRRVWLRSPDRSAVLFPGQWQLRSQTTGKGWGEVAEGQRVTIHRSPDHRGQRDQSGGQAPFITCQTWRLCDHSSNDRRDRKNSFRRLTATVRPIVRPSDRRTHRRPSHRTHPICYPVTPGGCSGPTDGRTDAVTPRRRG